MPPFRLLALVAVLFSAVAPGFGQAPPVRRVFLFPGTNQARIEHSIAAAKLPVEFNVVFYPLAPDTEWTTIVKSLAADSKGGPQNLVVVLPPESIASVPVDLSGNASISDFLKRWRGRKVRLELKGKPGPAHEGYVLSVDEKDVEKGKVTYLLLLSAKMGEEGKVFSHAWNDIANLTFLGTDPPDGTAFRASSANRRIARIRIEPKEDLVLHYFVTTKSIEVDYLLDSAGGKSKVAGWLTYQHESDDLDVKTELFLCTDKKWLDAPWIDDVTSKDFIPIGQAAALKRGERTRIPFGPINVKTESAFSGQDQDTAVTQRIKISNQDMRTLPKGKVRNSENGFVIQGDTDLPLLAAEGDVQELAFPEPRITLKPKSIDQKPGKLVSVVDGVVRYQGVKGTNYGIARSDPLKKTGLTLLYTLDPKWDPITPNAAKVGDKWKFEVASSVDLFEIKLLSKDIFSEDLRFADAARLKEFIAASEGKIVSGSTAEKAIECLARILVRRQKAEANIALWEAAREKLRDNIKNIAAKTLAPYSLDYYDRNPEELRASEDALRLYRMQFEELSRNIQAEYFELYRQILTEKSE